MIYTIHKGRHRAKPLRFGLYTRRRFYWKVKFDVSVRYAIGPDQLDINKLCGVGFFFGDNSARFGWRYLPEVDQVEILAYVHDKGKVTKSEDEVVIRRIDIGKEYDLSLFITAKRYWFTVGTYDRPVNKTHNQVLCFRQGIYFGGNRPAPQNITIQLTSH